MKRDYSTKINFKQHNGPHHQRISHSIYDGYTSWIRINTNMNQCNCHFFQDFSIDIWLFDWQFISLETGWINTNAMKLLLSSYYAAHLQWSKIFPTPIHCQIYKTVLLRTISIIKKEFAFICLIKYYYQTF